VPWEGHGSAYDDEPMRRRRGPRGLVTVELSSLSSSFQTGEPRRRDERMQINHGRPGADPNALP
jgi:hypothetical protein